MGKKITGMFDIDFPLFAFTPCRDVVVAVSKAGGLGVFGALHYTPARLREELDWIEKHIDAPPDGIDLVLPARFVRKDQGEEFDPGELWQHKPVLVAGGSGEQDFREGFTDAPGRMDALLPGSD